MILLRFCVVAMTRSQEEDVLAGRLLNCPIRLKERSVQDPQVEQTPPKFQDPPLRLTCRLRWTE